MTSYHGNYQYSMDEKRRVNLPSKFRRITKGKTFILSKGMEGCIFVFPKDRWSQYVKSFMPTTFGKKSNRDFFRLLGYNTDDVKLDEQGRIKIKEDFGEHAGLGKEVLIIGVMDHMEIWDPERWEAYRKGLDTSYEKLAEEALGKIDLSEYL